MIEHLITCFYLTIQYLPTAQYKLKSKFDHTYAES